MKPACRLLLLDLDGTVYEEGRAIPGAQKAISCLRRAGIPFRFLTNSTQKSRTTILSLLKGLNVAVTADEVQTAAVAARDFLLAEGAHRIRVLMQAQVFPDLAPLILLGPLDESPEPPDAVLVGDLGQDWNYRILNLAFQDLLAGSTLRACQRNRYWQSGGEIILDAGPFVGLLEEAAGTEALILGKPNAAFFHSAVFAALGQESGKAAMEAGEVWMVGDDLQGDVIGARQAGLRAIQLRSGKFRSQDEELAADSADAVLDSIADLPGHFLP